MQNFEKGLLQSTKKSLYNKNTNYLREETKKYLLKFIKEKLGNVKEILT